MVSAWAPPNELVLGQTQVADKSNEITAIPELSQLLDLTGCIVTVDVIGTQTKIAKTIIEGGGDYLLAMKENQGHLLEDIRSLFDVDIAQGIEHAPYQDAKVVHQGHGRIETREGWVTDKEDYHSLTAMARAKEYCANCFAAPNRRKARSTNPIFHFQFAR